MPNDSITKFSSFAMMLRKTKVRLNSVECSCLNDNQFNVLMICNTIRLD